MDSKYSEVGQRITCLRKQRGYTREKLAELSDISVQFLADIEKGRKSMTVNTLRNISAVLNTTTDYIVNGTVPAPPGDTLLTMLASMPGNSRKHAEKYEQENGVKLVDSIGTQMHVNCNVTKEKFRQELIELGKIGYPIEITEFDMMIPVKGFAIHLISKRRMKYD